MSRMNSLSIAFLVAACAGPPVPIPRNGTAPSDRPTVTAPVADASGGTASTELAEQVSLADIVAMPEQHLNRLVRIRGKAGVCPDLCDAIKFLCGTIAPASGPCTGYVALSFDESPRIEVRCNDVSRKETKNALPLDIENTRFVCRGHCGNWACPGFEVGRQYEVTARLRKSLIDEGSPRYTLIPVEFTALLSITAEKRSQ